MTSVSNLSTDFFISLRSPVVSSSSALTSSNEPQIAGVCRTIFSLNDGKVVPLFRIRLCRGLDARLGDFVKALCKGDVHGDVSPSD